MISQNRPRGSRPVKIVTNLPLRSTTAGVTLDRFRDWDQASPLALFRRLSAADAIISSLPSKRSAFICALAKRTGTRLVYYDVNIPIPEGPWDRIKRRLYLELVRRADLILTLHADTREYARLLRLPDQRMLYVGFKSNAWENENAVRHGEETQDSGTYVLACGRSYRDFATFVTAMAEAGLPARVLLTQGSLEGEGSIPPTEVALPENVELVQHDGSPEAWSETLLEARIVVVPLRADVIQPAGISVYLEAMNLSRPVIVTDGPSTRGMLDDSIAGVVRPGDSGALAREALKLWRDGELRSTRIRNARRYVEHLGGVERVSRDILEATVRLVARAGAPGANSHAEPLEP